MPSRTCVLTRPAHYAWLPQPAHAHCPLPASNAATRKEVRKRQRASVLHPLWKQPFQSDVDRSKTLTCISWILFIVFLIFLRLKFFWAASGTSCFQYREWNEQITKHKVPTDSCRSEDGKKDKGKRRNWDSIDSLQESFGSVVFSCCRCC